MISSVGVGPRSIGGSVPALWDRRLYRMSCRALRPHRTRTFARGHMNDPVERLLRAQSRGEHAVFLALLKSHVARMERFLDGLDHRRTAALLTRAYRAPASPN